jgi:hypothetical protein
MALLITHEEKMADAKHMHSIWVAFVCGIASLTFTFTFTFTLTRIPRLCTGAGFDVRKNREKSFGRFGNHENRERKNNGDTSACNTKCIPCGHGRCPSSMQKHRYIIPSLRYAKPDLSSIFNFNHSAACFENVYRQLSVVQCRYVAVPLRIRVPHA